MLTKLDGEFFVFVGTGHPAGDPGAPWYGERDWEEASWSAAGNEWPISQHSGFKDSTLLQHIKLPCMLYADLPGLGCIGWSPGWDARQHWDAGMMIDALSLNCYFSWYLQSHISFEIKGRSSTAQLSKMKEFSHVSLIKHYKRRELATELLALIERFSLFWLLIYLYTQVTGAAEHIKTGTIHLQDAKKLQKNTRKWTCIGIIILLIIILIVILSLKPWSWGK